MKTDLTPDPTDGERPDDQAFSPAPSGLLWPFKRLWWAIEKHLLWPVGDFFRRVGEAMRYRSPLAYIGATALVCLTVGAVATSVYFYNEANGTAPPVVADVPLAEDTVVAPVAPPTTAAPSQSAAGEDKLKGVVPDFTPANRGSGANNNGNGKKGPPETVVKPSVVPDSPPLKVAHRFARTFVGYELGEEEATRELRKSATGRLARQLSDDPPRLPSNGKIPKATVLNVVAGKKRGGSMEVSVSLMRSGATSELRLALIRGADKGWLVNEVRG
jgi:hypothetical protein